MSQVEAGAVPEHQGWFDETAPPNPALVVELLLIEAPVASNYGPWHVRGALIREPDAQPRWVAGWVDETWDADPPTLWTYIVDRDGGNGISWEVEFLRIAAAEDASAVAAHFDAHYRKEGLYGLIPPQPLIQTIHEPEPVEEAEDDQIDSCAEHVHVGMPLAAADALTWRLAVELVRRHPEELWILRTFPMDGMYDCLSIRRLPDVLASPTIAFNRLGTHVNVGWLGSADEPHEETGLMSWGNPYADDDPRAWIRAVEKAAGLAAPVGGLPPSTRSSLPLRWIGAFLASTAGSRPRWSAWNDWAELDYGDRPTSFDAIPDAAEWLRARGTKEAAALVWFVGSADGGKPTPALALSVDGHLWRADRPAIDLMQVYRAGQRTLTTLLQNTAGDLLPKSAN